jgi:hypothetical protein
MFSLTPKQGKMLLIQWVANVSNPHSLHADLDPALKTNADPDPK